MFRRENGHTKPDWSSIISVVVIIIAGVVTYYTAISALTIEDVKIRSEIAAVEAKVSAVEMTVELKLLHIEDKLNDIHRDIRSIQGGSP